MAFVGDIKYQSDFYNFFEQLVSVKIYKSGYSGAIIPVRTQKVTIECNYQDIDTGVIGTGAKVVIIADTDQLTQYEDLLTSLEKQFKCIIEYDNAIVFQGFSICDLNERQFLPYAAITLQFTDYLRRLESVYLPGIKNAGGMSTVLSIIQEAIEKIDLSDTLYVNSSLFEARMDQGETDSFLPQTYIHNYLFHSGPTDYDNGYNTLNKLLLSFGLYLYTYRGMWYLERQEDVLQEGDWLRYTDVIDSLASPDAFENQKQALHRQTDVFKYIEMSQVVGYESGLKTLILRLQDKQVDSFIFNDYDKDEIISTSDYFPDPGALIPGLWYKHDNVIVTQTGFVYRDMSSYIKWMYSPAVSFINSEYAGIYYSFQIQFPTTVEDPVMLNIEYKQSGGEMALPLGGFARLRFCLVVDGSDTPFDGYYITYLTVDPGFFGPDPWQQYPQIWALLAPGESNKSFETIINIDSNTKPVFSVSKSINLSDIMPIAMNPYTHVDGESYWSLLGYPKIQKFMIYFFPIEIYHHESRPNNLAPTQYLGDIQVTLSNQKVPNKLTYYINKDFEKTDEVDIDIFDLENTNFVNGPMLDTESYPDPVKSKSWVSLLNASPVPLMDVFAKNRFQNYARTIHRLKSKILYDGLLKPFAVLTDDNLKVMDAGAGDYGDNITFILQNFTWDLFEGIYDIDAQEYTDEDLGFDLAQDEGGETLPLTIPTNLDGSQGNPGDGFDLTWDSVPGATSYIIQRQPQWNGVTWEMTWRTIYEGPNTFTYDDLEMITGGAAPTNNMSFFYRVLAKTSLASSAYSSSLHLFYAAF